MDGKYVVKSIEERLRKWREMDRVAARAEGQIAGLGQAAADPRARDLVLRAKQLREAADREFAAILRAVKVHEHPGTDDQDQGEDSRRA